MRKQLFKAFVALGILGGAQAVVFPSEAFAQSGATVGSLRGVLKDKATGEPAAGATVVATSAAMVGEQVVITDETGAYFLTALPPGTYTLTIYYNNQPFSRPNVLVQLGKEAVVNVTVTSDVPKGREGPGEVITLEGRAPIVDQGSTKTGFTVTDDYTRNVPTGRTFAGVLGSVAGSQADQFGVGFSGAGSAENVYVVEGINTTDTGFGGISTNLPTEFIAETEIITGGYNAEFGRATGGIVNVVTKSGSNVFKGSVFGYFTPGALSADAKTIQREGDSIDSERNLDFNYDVGAEVGGPLIKDKLWFHVGFNPSSAKTTVTRLIQRQVDDGRATGNTANDGIPDIDPNTGFTIHEPVTESDLNQSLNTYFFTAKVNGAINQNHQFQLSLFGNPRSGDAVSTNLIKNPANATFRLEDGAYDASAKWTSKFNEGKTQVDAVLGFHRGFQNQKVLNASQDVAGVEFIDEHSIFDFAPIERGDVSGCNDADPADPYPMLTNCPVTLYRSQGLGFLEERTNDRASLVAAVTQRVKAAGYHTFKAGIDVDRATYNSKRGFTGAAFYQVDGRLDLDGDGMPDTSRRFRSRDMVRIVRSLSDEERLDPNFESMLPGNQVLCSAGLALCEVTDAIAADTINHSQAVFLQDSWQVRPNLTINAGVRWERQVGFVADALQGTISPTGETIPKKGYELNNLIAPRLGAIFDPTQEGKSKIFAHWGRFYENVPMDLNVRSFGGEIQRFQFVNNGRRVAGDAGYDPNCDVDFDPANPNNDLGAIIAQCPTDQRTQRFNLGEGITFLAPGLKGQYTQEVVLGGEYELIPDLKMGLNYIHRSLPTVIEDVSTDGGVNYLIANPGTDFSAEADDLRAESARLLMQSGCTDFQDVGPNCNSQTQALAALQDSRASQLDSVEKFDKPVRNYDALQLTIVQRPTSKSLVQASYTYSVSKGNYPGLFSTETGQLDPNITSLYDLPDLMANRYGNMGLDRPHNVKVDGFYMFDLKKSGLITTGASFRAISGIAHNALAGHPIYGDQESYLLPRGAIARSPVTFQTDVHVAYGYQVNKATKVEGFIRVFNLFNAQEELDVDEEYTIDSAIPIVGGDAADLAHVKALDGGGQETNTTVTPNKNFGKLNARQPPRSIQLGFRVTF
jgi:hypothetical protein